MKVKTSVVFRLQFSITTHILMKGGLTTSILLFLQISFSSCDGNAEVEYIKVMSLGYADSVTFYNKGVGLGDYLHYQRNQDSVVYRTYKENLSGRPFFCFSTAGNQGLKNALEGLIDELKGRPTGIVDSVRLSEGSAYCGPTYFVELSDAQGVNYYVFTLGDNKNLLKFSEQYHKLQILPSLASRITLRNLSSDSIAVAMLKGLRHYEQMPVPFIGPSCEATVDYSKILGRWRTVSTTYESDSSNYFMLTFKKNGSLIYERLTKGVVTYSRKMNFERGKDDELIFKSQETNRINTIVKLTDSCLDLKYGGEVVRHSRY